MTVYSAFGMTLRSDMELPLLPAIGDEATVRLARVGEDELAAEWSGAPGALIWQSVFPGARLVTVERGHARDQLIRYAGRASFRISPDAARVTWAGTDDASTRRFLLDTVLWWTALSRGLQLLHASAVELDGRVVAIVSHMGGGKSTLAGELLLGGAALFSDDVVALSRTGGAVAHPGPPLMNVPADRTELHALGRTLPRLHEGDDELWLAVDRASRCPATPAAVVLYRRADGLTLDAVRASPSLLELVPYAWGIPDDADAARQRFALLGDLTETVPFISLTAAPEEPPAAIAAALLASLPS